MTKRLLSLFLCLVMLLSVMLTSCAKSTDDESDVDETEDESIRQNTVLTIYAITDESTTEEGLAAVEEQISNYCIAKYKTGIDLRFYTEGEYQKALDAMEEKFLALDAEAEEQAKAEAEAQKQEKEYLKTLTAEEKRAYNQKKRLDAKKAEAEAKKQQELLKDQIEEGEDVATVNEVQMDIIYVNSLADYEAYAQKGALIDLSSYLRSGYKMISDYVYPSFITAATINDAIYGIPNNRAIDTKESYFVVNTALAQKYNVDWSRVRSINDLEDVFALVRANEPGVTPIYGDFEPEGFSYFTLPGVTDLGHTVSVVHDTLPGGRYDTNTIYKVSGAKAETAAGDTVLNYFATKARFRNAGYLSDTNTNFFLSVQQLDEAEVKAWEDRGYSVIFYKGARFTTEAATGFFGISNRCKLPDRAMEILQLITTDSELHNLLAFGIQDENYVVDTNGKSVTIVNDSYSMDFFKTGNTYLGYVPSDLDPDYIEKAKQKNLRSILSPFLGYRFDFAAAENEEWVNSFKIWDQRFASRYELLNYGTSNYAEILADIATEINTVPEGIDEKEYKSYTNFSETFAWKTAYPAHAKKLTTLSALLNLESVETPTAPAE